LGRVQATKAYFSRAFHRKDESTRRAFRAACYVLVSWMFKRDRAGLLLSGRVATFPSLAVANTTLRRANRSRWKDFDQILIVLLVLVLLAGGFLTALALHPANEAWAFGINLAFGWIVPVCILPPLLVASSFVPQQARSVSSKQSKSEVPQ
jgi:hypothetical protein